MQTTFISPRAPPQGTVGYSGSDRTDSMQVHTPSTFTNSHVVC